ncbi:MAG: histidinol-phosphate transaminase [Saprospiraceae bacterium]|nr:histidinol-phosphate transaminase [Saprospiraceae bacterium]
MKQTLVDIERLVRPNILKLKPYSSARSEFTGKASIFLDANENPYSLLTDQEGLNINRYPDPMQWQLKEVIAKLKGIQAENLFLGNGSDEVIDLLFKIFCRDGQDNIITLPPTYGMYNVAADIANIENRKVNLDLNYQPQVDKILAATDENTKLIFICNPNNPTGNLIQAEAIRQILENFEGIVVVDEAYIDFELEQSSISLINDYSNLVIMQTFSKAWAWAGMRLGMAITNPTIMSYFNKVKAPYNLNVLTQDLALRNLKSEEFIKNTQEKVAEILRQRAYLKKELSRFNFIQRIYPSAANFLFLQAENAAKIYNYLRNQGIIIRNRSNLVLCENGLRITVGTAQENRELIRALTNYSQGTESGFPSPH